MKTTQPNFDQFKSILFKTIWNDNYYNSGIKVLIATIGDFKSYHKKEDELVKEFKQWLSNIDIRQVPVLVKALTEEGYKLPRWLVKGRYFIDYTEEGNIDLIKYKRWM